MRHSTEKRWINVVRYQDDVLGVIRRKEDLLATEEPLEIRVQVAESDPQSVGTLMRTPGNDFELAVGFLISEGILEFRPSEIIRTIRYCGIDGSVEQDYNIVTIRLNDEVSLPRSRETLISSSCGICGTETIDQLMQGIEKIHISEVFGARVITESLSTVRRRQKIFEATGGVHAFAICDNAGKALDLREDVGRHNAFDKVVGARYLAGMFDSSKVYGVISGRIAFELVQKSIRLRIGLLVGVGAPTNLAVELANDAGITLCGFAGSKGMNVYSYPERIDLKS
ncbi:MAG: formate dehydrogenase accessory sulfurtransferase FdhD [Actinomycetota bacterium]|nr:formate dehydrogenase accessory sulfurtransferase FdhD [Actinomycetota bacterium]